MLNLPNVTCQWYSNEAGRIMHTGHKTSKI